MKLYITMKAQFELNKSKFHCARIIAARYGFSLLKQYLNTKSQRDSMIFGEISVCNHDDTYT